MADEKSFSLQKMTKDGKYPEKLLNAYRKAGFTSAGGLTRTRGPFAAYLMSEKGFEYEDIRKIFNGTSSLTADEKQGLVDDFVSALEANPILKTDRPADGFDPKAGESAKVYGRWFKNAVGKMKDIQMPSAEETETFDKAVKAFEDQTYKSLVIDMGQEFEIQWRLPGIGSAILNETGEDALYEFSCHESCAKTINSIETLSKNAKMAVFNKSFLDHYHNDIAGKKPIDIDPVANNLTLLTDMMTQSTTASTLTASPAGDTEKEFMRTGTLPEGYSLKVGGQTYEEYTETLKPTILEMNADLLNGYQSYDKKLGKAGVQELINKLPDNMVYDPAAPEADVNAVHNLYSHTVGHFMTTTNTQAAHAVGKKMADMIEVDGKPLSQIVEEKYAGRGLDAQQKQTAAEYEFASAISDKNKKLEYRPAKMDPATGIIAQPENGIPLMQGDAPKKVSKAQFDITALTKDGEIPGELRDVYFKAGFTGGTPSRARAVLFTYLLSEKGYSFEQAKDLFSGKSELNADEKQKLVDDFMSELKAHPVLTGVSTERVPHPDADENAAMYARWFKNSIEKMKDIKFPEAGEIKSPADLQKFTEDNSFLRTVCMDLGQEFEKAFKVPGSGSYMITEAGEDTFKTFTAIDTTIKALDTYTALSGFGMDMAAFAYPDYLNFVQSQAGKTFAETDYNKSGMLCASGQQMIECFSSRTPRNRNVKFDDFMETGKIEGGPVTIYDSATNEKVTLEQFHERRDGISKSSYLGMLLEGGQGYGKFLGSERIDRLIDKLPEELRYAPGADQDEIKAVHSLYANTAGHFDTYTSAGVRGAAGKKMADLICVDGKPLSRIVEEKYADIELDDDMKQTAAEYEYAAAITDKGKKLTYHPLTADPLTGEIKPAVNGKALPQYGKYPGLSSLDTVGSNFRNVEKAYFGHSNSKEYNRMLEYLDKTSKAPTKKAYNSAKEDLALKAVEYLEHTGYGKAKHEKSETRRLLAFQILYLTDPEKFKEAQTKANAQRDVHNQITPERLKNLPGVGLPAPMRTKVNLDDLAREEKAATNKKDASGNKRPAQKRAEEAPKKKRPAQDLNDAFIAGPPKKGKGKGK